MKKKEEIYVTKSSLPPLEEFLPYLEKLWETRLLTNMGEFHEQFKKELSGFLSVENTELFVNGHVALELLIESLGKKGEIITTPFPLPAPPMPSSEMAVLRCFAILKRIFIPSM